MALGVARGSRPGIDGNEEALVGERMWAASADTDFRERTTEGEDEDCCWSARGGRSRRDRRGIDMADVPITVNNMLEQEMRELRAGLGERE